MNHLVLYFVYFITIIASVNSLKLLLVFPIPAGSHYILGKELAKGLAKLGHDVTILSAFEEKEPPKTYTNIALDLGHKNSIKNKMNMFEVEDSSPYWQLIFINFMGPGLTEGTFNHTKFQAFLKSNQKFDAVIVEQAFNQATNVLAYHFEAPLIAFSTVGPHRFVNNLVANPENPSYIPDVFLGFSEQMTFYERLYNFIYGLVSDIILYNYLYPTQNTLMKKYFPNAPHLSEILNNVSLVITNSHESLNAAVPHVPNMIDIGGYHVNPPSELPKELQNIMDNAKEGVIYFSLGSNLLPSNMPKDKKDVILKVLGSRKEKVLFKWDEDILENKTSNIVISKWLPQQAILAHPNCKLFISHGGLLSLTEAVHLGVPVLAFPVFGDQKLNVLKMKSKGYGLFLPFSQIEEQSLTETLNEILENPSYKEKAQLCSKIIRDRPMKPIELADYWIKYIVRHKGAPHLRVAAVNLPLYKYYMLDVFGAILGLLLLFVFLLKKLCRLCCRKKQLGTASLKSSKKKRE